MPAANPLAPELFELDDEYSATLISSADRPCPRASRTKLWLAQTTAPEIAIALPECVSHEATCPLLKTMPRARTIDTTAHATEIQRARLYRWVHDFDHTRPALDRNRFRSGTNWLIDCPVVSHYHYLSLPFLA